MLYTENFSVFDYLLKSGGTYFCNEQVFIEIDHYYGFNDLLLKFLCLDPQQKKKNLFLFRSLDSRQ